MNLLLLEMYQTGSTGGLYRFTETGINRSNVGFSDTPILDLKGLSVRGGGGRGGRIWSLSAKTQGGVDCGDLGIWTLVFWELS